MNNTSFPNVFQEFVETSSKLVKGYETLQKIKEVEIAQTPKTLVWQSDKVKLYHYDRQTPATCKIPVLISFALLNRQDVLDLQSDRSLVKNLLDNGLDLYIMDWGYAKKEDRYLTMDDYINGYMNDAVDFIRKTHGIPKINKMGICQGGTLSTIYAALHPEKIQNLITLVTPIDFSTNEGLLFKWAKDLDIDAIIDAYGVVPSELLNQTFTMLKPMMGISKYTGIMNSLEDEAKMMNFLRMEKWKADSPDMAGECLRQFIKDCYQQNKLIKGTLEIGGEKVNLKNVTMPVMNIYATEDNLVPPAATIPLNDLVGSKDSELYKFEGGHIGVFVGARSQKELGPSISKWVKARV